MAAGFSKREVSRAGAHLAARLQQVRRGERATLVDAADPEDITARAIVEWWRAEHVGPMLAVYQVVADRAPDLDIGEPEGLRAVSFRAKRFDSTIDKLTREPGKLADMADIGGVRAVVDTQDDVDELAARLVDVLDVRRTRDWVRNPRATGYRAVHLHVRHQARTIEVQLRTFLQDAWANVVEEESRISGLNYKAGQGDAPVLEFFGALADVCAAFDLGDAEPDLFERFAESFVQARPYLRAPRLRDQEL